MFLITPLHCQCHCFCHHIVTLVTAESLFLHRELLQFCSCSSARGSIPSCPRVLSQAPTLEPWQVPPPCTDVATASCLRSVSHHLINKLSHGFPAVSLSSLSSRCFSVTQCAHITSLGLPPSVSNRDALARGSNVLCLQAVSQSPSPEKPSVQSNSHSSSSSVNTQLETSYGNHLAADCTTPDQQRGLLSHNSFLPGDCFS